MLAPPMNSYKIKQREIDNSKNVEFFCHFDDKYIIYSRFEHMRNKGRIYIDVYQLNGEVLQTVKFPQYRNMSAPVYSQSGEYMLVPVITDVSKQPDFNGKNRFRKQLAVYRIRPTEDFKKMSASMAEAAGDQIARVESIVSKDIIQLELFKIHDMPEEFQDGEKKYEEFEDFWWDEIQTLHVDNKGNCAYFNQDKSRLVLNGNNQTGNFKMLLFSNGLLENEEDDITWGNEDILRFGQGVMVAKRKTDIFVMKYDENKITEGYMIKHKAVDIEDQCDLDDIILPKTPKFILLFYLIGDALTIIVWDIEKDIEHLNFLGRKTDNHTDYVSGKNSKLGFLCFREYIVDLDV
jgi:hypothetical protein